jgi:hypothetical protein
VIDGCGSPVGELLRVLAYGKATVRAVGRPGQVFWDPDYQGLRIKNIHMRLSCFQQFVKDIMDSLVGIMGQDLFFGINPPSIDLTEIHDCMVDDKPMLSLLKYPTNKLSDGSEFMIECMRRAPQALKLIDDDGIWNQSMVTNYLAFKERFLKLLMLGISHFIPFTADPY